MSYDPRPGESSAQYWARKKREKPIGLVFAGEKIVKSRTKHGVTEGPHTEVRFQDKTEGTTVLAKVFPDGRIIVSMNGPIHVRIEDLSELHIALADYAKGAKL